MNPIQAMGQHSQWIRDVEEAQKLPPFPLNYTPEVVEIFDQLGVVCGIAFGVPYECDRPKDTLSEFMAWYLDGELALFYSGDTVLVDRFSHMAIAARCLQQLS